MPGANCAFPNCGASRIKKWDGIGIFRISQRQTPDYVSWSNAVINILKKYREVDADFRRQIESKTVATCERHYAKEDIEYTGIY